MTYHVITIFPGMLSSYLSESIIGTAIKNKIINVKTYALREYTRDKHRRVDGRPYGGGPGMVMWVDPIVNCIEKIKENINKNYNKAAIKYNENIAKYKDEIEKIKSDNKLSNEEKKNKAAKLKVKLTNLKEVKPKKTKILYVHFDTHGKKFSNVIAKEISKDYTDIIFICGRYEGVDYRVSEIYPGINISIGDYVLTGGELPAMIMIDSISRQIPGVLNKEESIEENRISSNRVYARPEVYEYIKRENVLNKKINKKTSTTEELKSFENKASKVNKNKTKAKSNLYKVPEVLLSGNHKAIDDWKKAVK